MSEFLNQRHGTYSDGKIYVIEVRDTDKKPSINIGIKEVYDPKLDKWKNSLKSMPTN